MIDLSMRQALLLWTELEQARWGVNKFGGDTAEIYAYRLLAGGEDAYQRLEEGVHRTVQQDATGRRAARRLYALIKLYEEINPDMDIRVEVGRNHDGHPYEWLLDHPLAHRTHVRVKSKA